MSGQYKVGKVPAQWSDKAQTILFVVSEDRNPHCEYGCITHKASNKRMDFETAKRFIDYILTAGIRFADEVIIAFFGGEPVIEMELVDQISDYFKLKAYELNHPWSWRYRFQFTTNSVTYGSPKVQTYIRKNLGKVSVGVSIDGVREKQGLNCVFLDGSSSCDAIEKNTPLWMSRFTPSTKMTLASVDLKHLKDSIIDLWNHGVTDVSANVVYGDGWKDGDDQMLEQQLRDLADYILDNKLFNQCCCTFFSDAIGGYTTEESRASANCGAGKMIVLSPDGKIYLCLRDTDYFLDAHKERMVGTVDTGIDMNLARPLMAASRYQDNAGCANCPIGTGCPQCQGFRYGAADTSINFQRTKYICPIQKARVRANEYYFAKLYNRFGIPRDRLPDLPKMYFLLSDQFVTFCCFDNRAPWARQVMTLDQIREGLQYCRDNFFAPVFVHGNGRFLDVDFPRVFEDYVIQHILPVELEEAATHIKRPLLVFTHDTLDNCHGHLDSCIYNIWQGSLAKLSADVIRLFQWADRINVNILNMDAQFDETCYLEQLRAIKDYLVAAMRRGDTQKELNLLTDLCYADTWNNCGAGERAFALAPNGKFYTCPAFYQGSPDWSVGTLSRGMNRLKNAHLFRREFHPICQACDAKQCRDCIYIGPAPQLRQTIKQK